MRILYLIDKFETNYPRDQNYIVEYMMKKGHTVEVITTKEQKFEVFDPVLFPTVKILRAPTMMKIKAARVYFHPEMLSKISKSYDVVHAFTFFTYSSILASFFRSGIKVIRSEIGPIGGMNFIKAQQGIYSHLVRFYRFTYDYVTAYNSMEFEALKKLGFTEDRIMVVPPMIEFERFSKLKKESIQTEEQITVGIIGRISPEKGMHKAIPIFKLLASKMPDYHRRLKLILAGRIDNDIYAYKVLTGLRRILGPNFIYIGEVASPYKFYKLVDVVIVPSLIETGAIVVLEAMAAGKCVIANNIYPINQYITHGVNGFLFDTVQGAVQILLNIIKGAIDLNKISLKSQKEARKYDYRLICAKLEKMYRSASGY